MGESFLHSMLLEATSAEKITTEQLLKKGGMGKNGTSGDTYILDVLDYVLHKWS